MVKNANPLTLSTTTMKAVMPAEDIKILIHQSIEVEQFPILNRLAEVEDILD